jgi:hypothetical protein
MSTLQTHQKQPQRIPYGTTTTSLVEDEPFGWDAAMFPVHAAVRPQKMPRTARPDRDSSSQLIRNFILSTGFIMPYEPAGEPLVSPDTITSAMPTPLPKVAGAIEKTIDDVEARPWRGIYTLTFPEEAIFTKQIDIRPEQLEEWQPRGVTSDRQVRNEDE